MGGNSQSIPAIFINEDTIGGGAGGGGPVTWASVTGKPTAFAPSAHAHAMEDITGLMTALAGKQNVGELLALISANDKLAANVTMASTNTWYTGASVSLDAGTWLIVATITLNRTTTTAQQYQARIYDGATAYASTQEYQASVANAPLSLALNTILTLSGSATVSVQAASSTSTNNVILAATLANGQGNNATQISAIKIAEAAL